MKERGSLAIEFPRPPVVVTRLLDELRIAAAEGNETQYENARVAALPRPWDPATCPSELRMLIYGWLDEVAVWINEEHTWRTDCAVPLCWQQHPHVVHELAAIACVRWEIAFARTPLALEEWHRYALPGFLNRIVERIGETGCPPGRHRPAPYLARSEMYRADAEASYRSEMRSAES